MSFALGLLIGVIVGAVVAFVGLVSIVGDVIKRVADEAVKRAEER